MRDAGRIASAPILRHGPVRMARKFLYLVAFLIVLAVAGLLVLHFYGNAVMKAWFVPSAPFEAQAAVRAEAYRDPRMWFARPEITGESPVLWTPTGYVKTAGSGPAVFFIHPTSYLATDHWNAPLDDAEANNRAAIFLRGQASAFNAVGDVWAPRYRQAAFGSFLTSKAEAEKALALAYGDVEAA